MEPDQPPQLSEPAPPLSAPHGNHWPDPAPEPPDGVSDIGLRWFFIGAQGLRAGWSTVIFVLLTVVSMILLGTLVSRVLKQMHVKLVHLSPGSQILQESIFFLSLLASAAIVAVMERRRILDYNLTGPRRVAHFFGGLAAGFLALSALVGGMTWGGWLHFGPMVLSGAQIVRFASLWAIAFLLVGLCEEGALRGFLQYTFTRGINFWWAFGFVAILSLLGLLNPKDHGAIGVDVLALLGLAPCLLLHLKKVEGSSFWQAAWATSTFFGFVHTGNNGESWIGIFAAGFIGFVFCASIRLTGSAWWAIGCHTSWDWAETFFYGTANSGQPAQGHLLTTAPAGSILWSGGASGPEGSLLVLPTIVLLLGALLLIYGRRQSSASDVVVPRQVAD